MLTCPAYIEPRDVGRIIVAHEYRAMIESLAEIVRGIKIRHCRYSKLCLSKWDGFLTPLTAQTPRLKSVGNVQKRIEVAKRSWASVSFDWRRFKSQQVKIIFRLKLNKLKN